MRIIDLCVMIPSIYFLAFKDFENLINLLLQLWSGLYKEYVDALVSWGYVVVQYQVPVISNPAVDRVEVSKFPVYTC